MKQPKVIIVGAGAAGLSCARELRQQNIPFVILEARDRVGGRAWSHPSASPLIEYGAEFIHGAHKEIFDLLTPQGGSFIEVTDHRHQIHKKRILEKPRFWEEMDKVSSHLRKERKRDRTGQEFINSHTFESPFQKQNFISYVEGFLAADLNFVGEKYLAESEQVDEPQLKEKTEFRPQQGYSFIIENLKKQAVQESSSLLLGRVVQKLCHTPESIEIHGYHRLSKRRFKLQAPIVVITLPLGVVKKLVVDPPLPSLQKALDVLHCGHIQRITFEFKTRFWENLTDRGAGFLHADPRIDFPTWWTQLPVHNNLLVAWQGGPRAYEMSFWKESGRVAAALKSLAFITRRTSTFINAQYSRHFTHNWSADPFSLGAYSYIGLQKENTPHSLHLPFAQKIIIAGEATARPADQGTVHGALQSGQRAARQAIELLSVPVRVMPTAPGRRITGREGIL
ncbi:flavin monoamine oxidase family protein [Bdellovibrio bacteriovorus]|nr:NAD(P)/FAD-dependent oxidoreductase [Bdellovibrio bacteriovorus]